MNAILEDKSILKDRLEKVRTAIHKATDDAWKQSTTSMTNHHHQHHQHHQHQHQELENSPRGVDNNNASFLLGMDLFGQDVSVLERGIRDKLEDVEQELEKLMAAAADQAHPDESMLGAADTSRNEEAEENNDDVDDEDDPEELAKRAKAYQKHIQFLKKASLARTALDESMTLSSPALTTTEPNLVQASQELMNAVEHVEQAQRLADSPTQQQQVEVAHQILTSLRQGIRRHRVELVHKAASVLDASIQINNNNNNSTNTTYNNSTMITSTDASSGSLSAKASAQLEAAYQVLETLEGGHPALQESMRRLTQRLYREILEPILGPHKTSSSSSSSPSSSSFSPISPWKVTEAANKPSKGLVGVSTVTSKGTVHRLDWQRDDDQGTTLDNPIAAWKDTFELLDRILSFVQSKVLLERPKLCLFVGTKLFGRPHALPSALKLEALGLESSRLGDDRGILMETLVELLSKTCLPDTPLESSAYLIETRQQLVEFCIPFCKSMASKQLLPEPDARPKLVAFCQDLEKLYVDHRRSVLLNQARDILTKTDYHNTVQVGVDVSAQADDITKVFQLHRCSISETSSKIMKLVRKTMDEAVEAVEFANHNNALSLLRPTLYRTARDMLHLFRAMIPASQGAQVRQVPRTAAVLHNDCIFLSHHCLTLGLEYKERFGDEHEEEEIRGKLLRQTCLFVDMVPLFRELADQCMGDMLDLQKNQVVDLVGSRISYFGKSLASNESLHEWSEAETALAAGLYHLRHLSQAWKPVLSDEVYGRSLGYLADVLFALYLQQVLKAAKISPNACSFTSALFRKAIDDIHLLLSCGKDRKKCSTIALELDRFAAIQQCLEMTSLSDIQAALARGVFRSIASQELSRLIRAVFDKDSQERNHLLNQLATVVE